MTNIHSWSAARLWVLRGRWSGAYRSWRGRPLVSYRTIVELIAATTTKKGLRIRAARDTDWYPTGVKITDAQLAAVPLTPHEWHGEWNYTINPPAQSIQR